MAAKPFQVSQPSPACQNTSPASGIERFSAKALQKQQEQEYGARLQDSGPDSFQCHFTRSGSGEENEAGMARFGHFQIPSKEIMIVNACSVTWKEDSLAWKSQLDINAPNRPRA